MCTRLCHDKLNAASTAPPYARPHGAASGTSFVIDNFALALCHGLMALAVWRLLSRPDLDEEEAGEGKTKRGVWQKREGRPDA